MSLIVTIFSAVQLEARAIAHAIEAPVPTPVLPVHSTFENLKIVHHLIGLRALGLAKTKIDPDTSYILLAGVAGALAPHLSVGDLILCDCPEGLAPRLEIPRGLIVTSENVVSTKAEKAELFSKTGAAVVDMETSVVRDFAAKRNLPFVSLRAVSDSSSESLDPQLVRLIDQWGRARWGEVWGYIWSNPFRIFPLTRLGRDSGRAARRLGEGVVSVLRAMGGI
jgi:phosphorylase superfamily protein